MKLSAFIFCVSSVVGTYNVEANTLAAPANSLSEIEYIGAHYGVFEYNNSDSLINSVKLLNRFGFNSSVVAETLNLKNYMGNVIVFRPDIGGKDLSYEDVFAAFKNFMKPVQLSEKDKIVIKNTPLSKNEGGTVIIQTYQLFFDSSHAESSQSFQIPNGGIALTVLKLNGEKLLLITSKP